MIAPASITCVSVAPDTTNVYSAEPPSFNVNGSALNDLISGGFPVADDAAVLASAPKIVIAVTARHKNNLKMPLNRWTALKFETLISQPPNESDHDNIMLRQHH
jgi:hypothetical protein